MRRLLPLAAAFALAAPALAQSSIFTYQGRLDQLGSPTSGLFDLRFRVLRVDGTQTGPTICRENVQVQNGLFTVQLDFGPVFTDPSPLNLAIDARPDTGLACATGTGYTALTPNQTFTAAPRAVHASSANVLAIPGSTLIPTVVVDSTGRVGVGTTTPQAALDVRSGGGSYVRIDTPNGDLRFNGGTDGFFGLYNEGAAAGRTEFLSSAGVNLSISNQTGNVAIGTTPTATDKLYVNGTLKVNGPVLYTTPQGTYKSIHGTAFMRQNDSSGYANIAELELDGTAGGGGACVDAGWFYAPVELPHGATVTSVIFYYFDNTPCGGFSAEFARVNLLSSAVTHLANLPYEDFNGLTVKTLGTTAIANPLIDNFNYAYVLRCRLQGNPRSSFPTGHMRIVGARIAYSVSTPVP